MGIRSWGGRFLTSPSASEPPPDPCTTLPFAAQIEEGMARWRADYLIWKQQQAVAEDRPAEGEELPREG